LLNITLISVLGFQTSTKALTGKRLLIAYLALIGCKAFVRNNYLRRSNKLELRVFIGWLVSYNLTNIFRI
ncbi:hypothetical protein K505DRAFT_262287, partial [Melanomma pulvis-pyrius CBS 109.77]